MKQKQYWNKYNEDFKNGPHQNNSCPIYIFQLWRLSVDGFYTVESSQPMTTSGLVTTFQSCASYAEWLPLLKSFGGTWCDSQPPA